MDYEIAGYIVTLTKNEKDSKYYFCTEEDAVSFARSKMEQKCEITIHRLQYMVGWWK